MANKVTVDNLTVVKASLGSFDLQFNIYENEMVSIECKDTNNDYDATINTSLTELGELSEVIGEVIGKIVENKTKGKDK